MAVVIHIMDGTLHGTDTWFLDPASRVSAHCTDSAHGAVRIDAPVGQLDQQRADGEWQRPLLPEQQRRVLLGGRDHRPRCGVASRPPPPVPIGADPVRIPEF
jgi:hypothetical protein